MPLAFSIEFLYWDHVWISEDGDRLTLWKHCAYSLPLYNIAGFSQLFAHFTCFRWVMCWHSVELFTTLNFASFALQLTISTLFFLLLTTQPLLSLYFFLDYLANTLHCFYPFHICTTLNTPVVGKYRWSFFKLGQVYTKRGGKWTEVSWDLFLMPSF